MKHFYQKLSSSLLLFLGLISLSNCSSNYGTQEPKVSKVKEGKGQFLRLSIHRPHEVVLRALKQDPMLEIKQLYMLFYDQATDKLKYVREARATSDRALDKLDVQLPSGDYKLVVLANPTKDIIRLTNVEAPLSMLTEAQKVTAGSFIGEGGALVMSNDQGPITIGKSLFRESAHESLTTPTTVTIEPCLARILVYGTPQVHGGRKGSMPVKYRITNVLQKTTVLRQLNKLSTGVMEQQGDNSSREQRYAKSSVWDAWLQSLPKDGADLANYPLSGLKAGSMSNTVYETIEQFSGELTTNSTLYIKETPVPENAFQKAYVPYALIAFPYIPEELQLQDGEGWLSYQGQYYSESQFKTMLQNNSLPAALRSVVERNHINAEKLTSSEDGFSLEGLNFYYKSYSYYPVFISHFGGDPAHAVYGQYGIVRGNEYRIHLVEVSSVGSATPILYTNDFSPIFSDKHTAISARVLDPVVRTQEVRF